MTNVVVVLSGGGAKCVAQVGALKALGEWGYRPSHFVGTSAGAVIGACFAFGMTYTEVLHRLCSLSPGDIAAWSGKIFAGPFAPALLRESAVRKTIAKLVPVNDFQDLEVPLTVTAVDVRSGQLILLGEGGREHAPLQDSLYASCALPVYLPPGRMGDRDLVDGGLRSVLPLDACSQFSPDLIYAVRTGPSLYSYQRENGTRMPSLLRAHSNATRILMATQTDREIERARSRDMPLVLVEPSLPRESSFDLSSLEEFVERGYREAHRALSAQLEA